MKKIMMMFFVLIILFNTKNVFAQDQYKLTLEKKEGIYFSRKGKNFNDDSSNYYIYKFGNMFAYCIQPGQHIATYDYLGMDNYVDLPYSDDVKEKIELIGYYGRDYPGHNTIRYSMAAQALIWELTGVDSVTFWTKQYEQGEEINVSTEKDEIIRLVNQHLLMPNINKKIIGSLDKELVISDANMVLDNYEIENNGGNEIIISNNKFYITPKVKGESTITLKHKRYGNSKTIIFVGKDGSDSQIMGRFRFSNDKKLTIKLNVNNTKLIVNKVDENNNRINISGIRFKIKNTSNDSYLCENTSCEYLTDVNGSFTVNDLGYGEYEIEEVENQLIYGYTLNKEKLKIIINQETNYKWQDNYNYIDVNFVNKKVLGKIYLYKKSEQAIFENNEITYKYTFTPNIEFEVYDVNNKLIKTVKTDNNGSYIINDLPMGMYYITEKTVLDNYIPSTQVSSYNFVQTNPYTESISALCDRRNYLKKGTLEFIKEDYYTGEGISNTTVGIYNENNKLLLTRETNEKGKIIIENLPYGKYYIKEEVSNDLYQKTDEKKYFEIKENKEVVKVKMTNKLITGNLEVYKKGEKMVVEGDEISYQQKALTDFEFNLYNDNNELISVIKTDSNGYFKYNDLPIGKYYLLEKTKLDNYISNNEKVFFEIKNSDENNVSLNINNYLKKGRLEFSKEDLTTSEGIPDTIIEIYDEDNDLILTQKTDLNGKIIINNLAYGKYYIIEKEANSNYQITNEKVYFEIKENEEIVKAKMTNEKIVIEVPKTNTKEGIIVNLLFVISILIALGRFWYERKKAY